MKLKLGQIPNKTLRIKNQNEIFNKIFDNNFPQRQYKSNLSGENILHFKNSENINFNTYSILEYNNLNNKRYKRRGIHSASLLKSRNTNKKEENKNPTIIYNIKQIHQIISAIEKKINSFNDISKDNISSNNYNFSSINYNTYYNNNNQLYYRNSNNRRLSNRNDMITRSSRTFIRLKNDSFPMCKESNSNLKKNELIPYPFKRLQNKIRKYFALCKNYNCYNNHNNHNNNNDNVKLSEEPPPISCPNPNPPLDHQQQNKYLLKIRRINENNFLEKKKELLNQYKTKISRNNKYNRRNIFKKDKSVSTENIIIRKNLSYLNNNNGLQNNHSLFNNKLIASLTKNENKFFLTTSNKKKKQKDNSNRGILVYYKNY